jgi:hypothetical protein
MAIFSLVIGLAVMGMPAAPSSPRGIFLPVGSVVKPAIPGANVQSGQQAPASSFTYLGQVNVEIFSKHGNDPQAVTRTQEYARQLAAKHGANYVQLSLFTYDAPDTIYVLWGKAYSE